MIVSFLTGLDQRRRSDRSHGYGWWWFGSWGVKGQSNSIQEMWATLISNRHMSKSASTMHPWWLLLQPITAECSSPTPVFSVATIRPWPGRRGRKPESIGCAIGYCLSFSLCCHEWLSRWSIWFSSIQKKKKTNSHLSFEFEPVKTLFISVFMPVKSW